MRPQDMVILLKISTLKNKQWLMKDIAYGLHISASEVSESLNRSMVAGLIASDKKTLMTEALMEFLQYGIKYTYPQRLGPLSRGMATAFSAKPLSDIISSTEHVVWPFAKGNVRGQAIEPLHPAVPEACMKDQALYELLALTDAIRIGKAREQSIAITELRNRIC